MPVVPHGTADPVVPPGRPSSAAAAGAVSSRPAPTPPTDPRDPDRVRPAAGASPSLWWACTGIVVAVVVAFAVGAPQGAFVLAAVLAVSALARAVLHPGPVALTVRSRPLDTVTLAALALGVGLLAHLVPPG